MKKIISALLATVMVLSTVMSCITIAFAAETEGLATWNVADSISITSDKEVTFTAPVRGKYVFANDSMESVSGDFTVSVFAGGEKIGDTISIGSGNSGTLPDVEIEVNKDEILTVKFEGSGEIQVNFDVVLIDEMPTLIAVKSEFVVADELQLENVTAETPKYKGIFSVGFVTGSGLAGADLTYTNTAYYVAASGYTHYNGKSANHDDYNLRAFPTGFVTSGYYQEKSIAIHNKNEGMQGVTITANRAGTYTLSSTKVSKDGTGAATLKIEQPDGTVSYSITSSDADGFEVSAELKVGEKMYLYSDRGSGWNTSAYYIYDLQLSVDTDEELFEEDPNYKYVYEDHFDNTNYADRLAAAAKYEISGGVLTVTFPEKEEDNTVNYNWAAWIYKNDAWVELTKADALTLTAEYDGTLAEAKLYVLCTDEKGNTLYNTYTEGGAEDLWIDDIVDDASDYDYSFAVVGDTQMIVRDDVNSGKNNLGYIYDWLVENAESRKIKQVVGVGDITETREGLDSEWTHAKTEIDKLKGVIPYALAQGNHDNHTAMNNYFGSDEEYVSQFDGFYTEGDITVNYTKFDIGDEKFLLITLSWGPDDAELQWASDVIEQYPDRKVIISTHIYLETDGTTQGADDTVPASPSGANNGGANNGDRIWDKLVSQHENIFLVLSGHIDTDDLVVRQEKGVHGNVVTSLLVNPQTFDQKNNFNTGMVAMLYFSDNSEKVRVEYYSTCRDQFYGAQNQFELETTNHVFKSWELGGTYTGAETLTYTADVDGIFNLSQSELTVSGEWNVTVSAGGEELASAVVSEENAKLPTAKYIRLNNGETIEITLAPVSAGSINLKYSVDLIDEIAPKISYSGVVTEKLSVADGLQLTNTTVATAPTSGLFTVGYITGTGSTGKDLEFGTRNSLLIEDGGYSRYFGNYNGDASYTLDAYPSTYVKTGLTDPYAPNTVAIHSKNNSVHGVVITADKAGLYTLSSRGIIKDGMGEITLKIETPDEKTAFSYTDWGHPGFEVTAELEAGEKIYLYADKSASNWSTAAYTMYDLFLTREVEGETLIDDPDYEYKYEYHETVGAIWETVRKATCCTPGIEMRRCTLCHEEAERRETDLAEHSYTYSSWNITALPDYMNKGEREMLCSTYGCSEKKVEVLQIPTISNIAINSEPADMTYMVGEEFDPTGLQLELSYEGYTHTTVVSDFENVEFTYDFSTPGESAVIIDVNGVGTSLTVNVVTTDGTLGDCDGNGEVNIIDVQKLFEAVNNAEIDEIMADTGDYDGNGAINILDVRALFVAVSNGEI